MTTVTITDEMIERAAKILRVKTAFTMEVCRKLARAALEAALSGKEE